MCRKRLAFSTHHANDSVLLLKMCMLDDMQAAASLSDTVPLHHVRLLDVPLPPQIASVGTVLDRVLLSRHEATHMTCTVPAGHILATVAVKR